MFYEKIILRFSFCL